MKYLLIFSILLFSGCTAQENFQEKTPSLQYEKLFQNTEKISPYIQGNKILDPLSHTPLQLRGVNLGQWFLLESYLWGLYPEQGYQKYNNIPQNELLKKLDTILPKSISTQEFWNQYQQNFITQWDFTFLKDHDINMVRVPIHHFMFENDLGISALKRVITLCEENKIYCLLDIHAVAGAQSSYSPSDPINGTLNFWHDEDYQNQYFEDLALLSDISQGKKYVIGYDVLNEPEVEDIQVLRDFYTQVITFLRSRGDTKILVLQTNKVSLHLEEIYLGDGIENILYSAHYYGGGSNGKESFQSIYEFTKEKNIPFFIGEYGNWANDVFAQYSNRFLIYDFEIYQFHYAYWPYKDLIPESPNHNTNFGLFSGPDDLLWQEFFTAIDTNTALREDFSFDKFFRMIRSENLEEKNFVVDLLGIHQKNTIEIPDPENMPERWKSAGRWESRTARWKDCNNKNFSECREISKEL